MGATVPNVNRFTAAQSGKSLPHRQGCGKAARASALKFQEAPFERQSATVSHQFASAADHAMAWDHNRHRVSAIARANGAHRLWRSDGSRNLEITSRFAEGNSLQLLPDAFLKIGAAQIERYAEFA